MLRDQIVALTHSDDVYVRSVMVFPKAHVEAKCGTTGHVHCVTLSRLHDYIDNGQFSQKLNQSDLDRYVRAMHGIAGMDKDFGPTAPIVGTEA